MFTLGKNMFHENSPNQLHEKRSEKESANKLLSYRKTKQCNG